MHGRKPHTATHARAARRESARRRALRPSARAGAGRRHRGRRQAMEGQFREGARRIATAEPLLRAHGNRWDFLNAEYLHLMALSLLGELREVDGACKSSKPRRARARICSRSSTCASASQRCHGWRTMTPPVPRRVARACAAGRSGFPPAALVRGSSRGANFDFTRARVRARGTRSMTAGADRSGRFFCARNRARRRVVRARPRRRRDRPAPRTPHAMRAASPARASAGQLGSRRCCAPSIDPSPAAFDEAARILSAADFAMHAAVARRRAGREDPWWRQQAVVNPDGFVRCFAPGGAT